MPKELYDDSCVTRQCASSKVSNGRPMPAAFQLGSHEFLSVCWLEYFGMPNQKANMIKVQKEVAKHREIRAKDQFAVLNVYEIKKTLSDMYKLAVWIEDLEEDEFPSHTGIRGYTDADFDVAIILSDMVEEHNMYPKLI